MEKFRSRKFAILLYPESPNYNEILDNIKMYDYAYILHNKDINENGDLKKEHTHVIINSKNAIWNTALSKELGITENYIQRVRNYENALEYLIHYNEPEKFQYSIDDVKGNLKTKLLQIINTDDRMEEDKMLELIDFIQSVDSYLSIDTFSRYCCSNGMWSEFRRNSTILINLLHEHNSKYIKLNKNN